MGGSDAGAAKLVAGAEAQGVHVGVHTISDFISPTTPTSPRPIPLGRGQPATLTRPLAASDTTLYLTSAAPLQDGVEARC